MSTPRDEVQLSERHLAVARVVIFGGRTFRDAMLSQICGARRAQYTQKSICERSAPFRIAFEIAEAERRAETIPYSGGNPGDLKTVCIERSKTNVQEGEDRGARSVALWGRLKEHDWFLREGGVAVGFFATLGDSDDTAIIGQTTAAMKAYVEHPCAWRETDQITASALQAHALTCPKRPLTIPAFASSGVSNEE